MISRGPRSSTSSWWRTRRSRCSWSTSRTPRCCMGRYAQAGAAPRGGARLRRAPAVGLRQSRATATCSSARMTAAREMYRQAIESTEESGEPTALNLGFRAQALARLGRREEAVTTIERAVALAPDAANVAYHAALVYALIGDTTSALERGPPGNRPRPRPTLVRRVLVRRDPTADRARPRLGEQQVARAHQLPTRGSG